MGLLQAMGSRKGLSTSRLLLSTCLLLMSSAVAQTQHVPAVLNLGNLPETSFSCEGKVVGGYYTDFETNCQMFHVCTLGSKGETQDIKFLCLQGTVFDQKKRVCERSEEVLCTDTTGIFDVNRELFHNSNKVQLEFDGDVADNAVSASVAHRVPALDADYPADGGHFPPSDYTDDFVGRARSGGTRSEVPLFARPERPVRAQQSVLPSQLPFSRFRSGSRRAGRPSSAGFGGAGAGTAAAQSVTVPIIPRMSDSNRPRVVVTNGKPFVPKLDAADSAPKITQEEDFPSLTLPETNFSCEGKVSGGHYADPETNCRMFHICVIAPDDTITDHKFLCGNNTAFEQKSRTCQEIEKIDCASSVLNYYVNNHLIIPKWLENLARRQALKGRASPSQISQGRAIATRDALKPAVQADTAKPEPVNVYDDYYDYYLDYPDYTELNDASTTERSVHFSSDSREKTAGS